MPTIPQLPSVSSVTAADIIPLVQGGIACSANVGTLLSSAQPAIITSQNSLLGRVSVGSGGPEQITVGTGLNLIGANLHANGGDHAGFPIQETFQASDALVISSGDAPNLLPVGALRGLFSAGSNVIISSDGIISSTALAGSGQNDYLSNLPVISDLSTEDVVYVSQNGTDCAISIGNLLNGESVYTVSPAAPASDSDSLLVAQAESTLVRQTLAGIWTWVTSKIVGYELPVVELASDANITTASHNGRLVICSKSLTLSASESDLNSGFRCEVVNVSQGDVNLSDTFISSSGGSTLSSGQSMTIISANYSEGTLIYASLAGASVPIMTPNQVTNLTATAGVSASIELVWAPPNTAQNNLCYTVLNRLTGSEDWTAVAVGIPTNQITISPLNASTSYDFIVIAAIDGVAGLPSNVVTAVTANVVMPVSAPINIAFSNATSSSITVAWSPSSGSVERYNVEYRQTGSSSWNSETLASTSTTYTATGLNSSQSYDWQVTALGSDGSTATSSVVSCSTTGVINSVSSIVWNSVPSGPLVHGNGALAVNAHVSPSNAAVRFGIANSETVLPSGWVEGTLVNSDLWGAYIPTPATAGTWYVCCQGLDGSSSTFCPIGIQIS